jgi:hypothetical protein
MISAFGFPSMVIDSGAANAVNEAQSMLSKNVFFIVFLLFNA